MEYRFGSEGDLDLLAEWNYQLVRDEGHRNLMSVGELRERMKGWLEGEYKSVIFQVGSDSVAYALYREDVATITLRQLFVKRGFRRQGIGRAAMEILLKEIWANDKRLIVEVLTANEGAVAFWRAVGYCDYCLTLEIMPKDAGGVRNFEC
ncbi:MAG: GNAT family N-acetyltransferase [Planctomycetes bacterium]|nr:GNAT family N-acetyltransferase [Planctomycetota bacterium]